MNNADAPTSTQRMPLVMTVIGKDRRGLVESIAGIVAEHGGNWLESRMCRLGGEFAGILRVHVPADRQAALTDALHGLGARGLSIVVRPDQPESAGTGGKLSTFEIVGQDRPGIVREITRALARHGVNVEEFSSECQSAAMTGETLFTATATVRVPETCDLAALRQELESIAADLVVDISFSEPCRN